MEHTKKREDNKHWAYWGKDEVASLLSQCTLITADKKDDSVLRLIEELAKAYRSKSNQADTKNMAEDINSVGDYGDSKIAAIAALVGFTLVTNNEKDFIFDKNIKKHNDNIRRHINMVNANNPYATDATVVSAEELITGTYNLPTRERAFNLIENNASRYGKELQMA